MKNNKTTCTTRSLVVTGSKNDKEDGIGQLLLFNNLLQEEKDLYTYIGHWLFVPFHPTGEITQQMISGMIENQNYFLENQVSIAVQGFANTDMLVEDTEVFPADEGNTSMEG
eukprot:10758378-Ditylum_brightwellii.AAC.1